MGDLGESSERQCHRAGFAALPGHQRFGGRDATEKRGLAPAERGPTVQDLANQRAKALLALPRGFPWTSRPDRDILPALSQLLSGLLWQLATAHAVSPADLRVWETKKRSASGGWQLHFAVQEDLKALRLRLLPFPARVLPERPPASGAETLCLPVTLKFGELTHSVFLLPPERLADDTVDSENGPRRVLYPYWDILGVGPVLGATQLAISREWVDVPLGSFSAEGALRLARATKRTLKALLPFLTNDSELAAATKVCAAGSALCSATPPAVSDSTWARACASPQGDAVRRRRELQRVGRCVCVDILTVGPAARAAACDNLQCCAPSASAATFWF